MEYTLKSPQTITRKVKLGDIFEYGDAIWLVISELSTNHQSEEFGDDSDWFNAFCLDTREVSYFDADILHKIVELTNAPTFEYKKHE